VHGGRFEKSDGERRSFRRGHCSSAVEGSHQCEKAGHTCPKTYFAEEALQQISILPKSKDVNALQSRQFVRRRPSGAPASLISFEDTAGLLWERLPGRSSVAAGKPILLDKEVENLKDSSWGGCSCQRNFLKPNKRDIRTGSKGIALRTIA